METQKVYDYIDSLLSLLPEQDEFKKCDFAILCDKYPINVGLGNFIAKVLYISIKNDKKTIRIYPDTLKRYNLETIKLTSNSHRRINEKFNEFFVNGNNEQHIYKDYPYFNYSIEKVSKNTMEMIEKLREKYQLKTPELFVGEHQELVIE